MMKQDMEETDIKAVQDKNNPSYFQHLPNERKTEAVCYDAVFTNPDNVKFVPENAFTYEITGLPLLAKPELISYIPEKVVNKILPYVLADAPELFQNFPKESLTPSVCMAGVKGYGYNLEFVPEGMKTEEMCREALKASPDLGYGHAEILAHVPYPSVCLEAMKEFADHVDCVDLIRTMRKEAINEDIAKFAVSQNGHCLVAVPIHLQTSALACQATITSGNSALRSDNIREDVKTEEAYKYGMDKDLFQSFLLIPKAKRTPELCLIALKWFPERIAKQPEEIPDNIRNGCNMFSLNAKMEQCTGEKFNTGQMKGFYNGLPLKVKSIHTPQGELKNTMVKFDKEKQEFSFSSVRQEKRNRLKI